MPVFTHTDNDFMFLLTLANVNRPFPKIVLASYSGQSYESVNEPTSDRLFLNPEQSYAVVAVLVPLTYGVAWSLCSICVFANSQYYEVSDVCDD